MKRAFVFTLIFLQSTGPCLALGDRPDTPVKRASIIASAHPLATSAGIEVLKRGGNAVDAAVAVQMVLTLVEPHASGIGGGCFILYYDAKSGRTIAIDGREEAPKAAYPELFLDQQGRVIPFYPERITGGRAVGVPGCVKALRKLWGRHGSRRIEWKDLFQPAIKLSENGFAVSAKLAEAIEGEKERLKLFQSSYDLFFNSDGTTKRAGELFLNKDLGRTLRILAEDPGDFYRGRIAEDIVKAVKGSTVNPGLMSLEDLANYDAPERAPLMGTYRGFDLYSMPPPSSGGTTLLEALNILEEYPIHKMKRSDPDFVHLFSESQKLAFADRNRYLADPDFADVPVRTLVSKTFAADRRLSIDPARALSGKAEPLLIALGNTTTSHVSVSDAEGNVLSMTTTIEHIFGSALVVPGRGFVLNNELTDFSADPFLEGTREPSPNRVEGGWKPRRTSVDIPQSAGGKRPLSSMTPTIVFKDGRAVAALGSPGGTQIIGIVLNMFVNFADFGMDAQSSVAAPRIINRNGALELEEKLFEDEKLIGKLKERGHEIVRREPFGNGQIVILGSEGAEGASDPRGEGTAQKV